MVNIFNHVFVNTAHKVNEKIPSTRKSPLDYLLSRNTHSFFVSPVFPAESKIIIDSMKNGKAVRPYSIPVLLLKILSEHISISLCEIINDSFSSGIVPYLMELAKVIPL